MDWRSWLGLPGLQQSAAAGRGQGWRWRGPESGKRLGVYGRGAPRVDLPSAADLQRTAADLQARWENYQERHPYRALAGNLIAGILVGFVLGRWAARNMPEPR